MRILLVNDYGTAAGGAERVTHELRSALRARGHDARLLASTASPVPLPVDAEYPCYGTNGWARPFLQVLNPSATRALRRALAAFQPDLVHVRMFLTQLSPAILPLLAGRPALLHVGNQQITCPLNTKILPDGSPCGHRAGRACHRAGCVSLAGLARTTCQLRQWRRWRGVFRSIVANSHALAGALEAGGVPVDEVAHNGTRLVPPRPPLGDPPTIACAGRVTAVKGVDDLISAMPAIIAQVPGARLLVAGDGPERARIERQIAATGLQPHVTMLGHLARLALDERLAQAWVHVTPSRYPEPFANTTLEAMARGTAVVGTAVGGTPEAVDDGVTGFLVPPGDPARLATALVRLLRDRPLAEQMGAAGRARVLRQFTVDHMVDRFERVYARITRPAT